MKIVILANYSWGIWNFRRELLERLLQEGHQIIVISPYGEMTEEIVKLGCKHYSIEINRHGVNPLKEIKLILKYFILLKQTRPDIIFSYTIKPNIYGGITARLHHIPYIINITGLGKALQDHSIFRRMLLSLYGYALKHAQHVYIQNSNIKHLLDENGIHLKYKTLIPGSGVNLYRFSELFYPDGDKGIHFLYIGRLMRDKGIHELMAAIPKVIFLHPNTQFHFVGCPEEDCTNIVPVWQKQSNVFFHGPQRDVQSFLDQAHCLINPSWHEGMSNVCLEAAASARPILASNIPGCQETFEEGVSGFGFQAKNAQDLAQTIIRFIELPHSTKKAMGKAGRLKVEREFDRNTIVDAYLKELNKIKKETLS